MKKQAFNNSDCDKYQSLWHTEAQQAEKHTKQETPQDKTEDSVLVTFYYTLFIKFNIYLILNGENNLHSKHVRGDLYAS